MSKQSAHACAYARACTHTHTHTHIYICVAQEWSSSALVKRVI